MSCRILLGVDADRTRIEARQDEVTHESLANESVVDHQGLEALRHHAYCSPKSGPLPVHRIINVL